MEEFRGFMFERNKLRNQLLKEIWQREVALFENLLNKVETDEPAIRFNNKGTD
jgi:hypothetical protein